MHIEDRDFLFEEKDRIWRQQEEEVNKIADRLGKRIDKGIKEAVIALRVLGFTTTGSCEGHLDWGLPGPWVEIGGVPKEILTLVKETRKDPSKLDEQTRALFEETAKKGIEEKARLVELLTEFYQDRKVSFDQMLILKYRGDYASLINQGTEIYRAYDKAQRQERLTRYQEEMRAFTEFARNKFFTV